MSAFDRLSRMCGPQVPPELLALLGEHRAEVLNEAADVAVRYLARYADLDAVKAAGIIGPHTMAGAISDELHRLAAAPAVPVPDDTAEEAAVRRSVNDQFPKVAAFLAEENTAGGEGAEPDRRRRLYVDGRGRAWIDQSLTDDGTQWIACVVASGGEFTAPQVIAETGSLREIGRCW